jgi:hypothetical protein
MYSISVAYGAGVHILSHSAWVYNRPGKVAAASGQRACPVYGQNRTARAGVFGHDDSRFRDAPMELGAWDCVSKSGMHTHLTRQRVLSCLLQKMKMGRCCHLLLVALCHAQLARLPRPRSCPRLYPTNSPHAFVATCLCLSLSLALDSLLLPCLRPCRLF